MKKTLGLVFLCSALVFSSLLSACGGGNGEETTAVSTQVTSPAATHETPAITIHQPQQTSDVSSPYSDILIFPGAESIIGDFEAFVGSIEGAQGGVDLEWHFYKIDGGDIDEIMNFYNDRMPEDGWQLIMEMDTPQMEGSYQMYMKGSDTATIMTFKDPDNMTDFILAIYKARM